MSNRAAGVLAACLVPVVLAAGCGKDEADFEDLKGEFGAIPGAFNLRLGQGYRDKVDSLQSRLDGLVPGASAQLTTRLAKADGDEETVDAKGTKLSDLLALKLPGTESAFVNQRLFSELTRLAGDQGPYFDAVDTGKFLKGPSAYEPPVNGTPDYDQNLGAQYYLDMIRWKDAVKDVDALLPTAAPVVVAVLDTGVHAAHEDLDAVMWQNAQGAVGYDAHKGRALAKSEARDGNGHGTHVAGIVAGRGRNGKGIHGVGYLPRPSGSAVGALAVTEIMDVKVLNDNGAGTSEQIASGLKWAVNQHWSQKSAVAARAKQKLIVNMSLGGPFEISGYDYQKDAAGAPVFEDDVINYATSKDDVLVVVAAGNETCGIGGKCDLFGESYKQTYYYPCSYKNVLCVAATTHEDKLAGFSNRRASVGLAAPGWQIVSTLPEGSPPYGYYSGTSQATPVTSGAAAVVWSLYPQFKATEIKAILQKSASRVASVSGQIDSGDGRLDLKAALAFAKDLAAAGASPLSSEPAAGVVDNSAKAATAPAGGDDPDAPSKDAVATSPADKGKGSGNGCGVVGVAGGAQASPAWLLLLGACAPLALVFARRRRAGRR